MIDHGWFYILLFVKVWDDIPYINGLGRLPVRSGQIVLDWMKSVKKNLLICGYVFDQYSHFITFVGFTDYYPPTNIFRTIYAYTL